MSYLEREIITAKEIMQKLRFNARSSFDEFCSDESVNFPKAIRIGIRRKGWFVDEVESWLKNRDKERNEKGSE
ncbi:helix-turn-helix transcriptional regulator [Pantoea stewartii]|uniref:AlpA family phage regulatory protein n=1 Tax=Pantoea stewartii subsp. stewartii DC283 TaxID=660596 RepID=H3RBK4_PANSE|nr:AlpA family phage regulatory protein [Pantoea stewartii]ARF49645.1 hypothetical protein DSJ_10035 [Pantoea stewartii subsp. stewartii DC283]EHU01343.1 hypothetical protein CKS_4095 [Pantoea stewartii subsp. stewartii DC283]KAB0560010.1 AlpA family phage regulatory protein [Pantoea stewartii subsp. stewartii]